MSNIVVCVVTCKCPSLPHPHPLLSQPLHYSHALGGKLFFFSVEVEFVIQWMQTNGSLFSGTVNTSDSLLTIYDEIPAGKVLKLTQIHPFCYFGVKLKTSGLCACGKRDKERM